MSRRLTPAEHSGRISMHSRHFLRGCAAKAKAQLGPRPAPNLLGLLFCGPSRTKLLGPLYQSPRGWGAKTEDPGHSQYKIAAPFLFQKYRAAGRRERKGRISKSSPLA
jgi:hypothetical protein